MINQETSQNFVEYFYLSFFFLLGFFITFYISRVKGFSLLPKKRFIGAYCKGIDVFINIVLFVLSFGIIGSLVIRYLPIHNASKMLTMTLIPVISFFCNIALIFIYSLFKKDFIPLSLIKDKTFPSPTSIFKDAVIGLKTLFLSFFPLYSLLMLIEGVTVYLDGRNDTLQEAVRFLMEAKKTIPTLSFALFTIIFAAPIIEEFIFRGCAQSFLRKKFRSTYAIVLTSILFSLFHFSTSQGLQNIPILISLFVLSIYLGFCYEKTRSLISSITLHLIFNSISALKIIFFVE